MDSLRISAIVPTRGRPAMLAEAVASVLAQTRLADEVLVVEEGEEGEAAALRRLEGVRVLPGPRRGPGAARNVGLRAARGDLVAFLDDDDLWAPGKLEAQLGWFEARAGLGVLGTWCGKADDAQSEETLWRAEARRTRRGAGGTRSRSRVKRVSRRSLLRGNRLVMSSVLARRECLLEAGGFDEGLPLAQDWDLWLRVAGRWEIGVVQEELTRYRRHRGQRSADRAEMRRWEGEVVRRALARERMGTWLQGVGRRRLAWAHARLGRLLLKRREVQAARAELRESMELFPFNPVVWSALARCVFARPAVAE